MEPIPEIIVEKTWQEVAGFNPLKANKEMMKIGNSQPELLAFIMELTREMDQEVRELGIYIFFVIYRMFQKAKGKIKRISAKEISEFYEYNETLMEKLEEAHEKFFDRAVSIQISRQPYVVKYLVDTLMEEEEDEGDLTLTEEQKGFLFLLLKTVIDVLDQKVMKP
jgi:hypothetical protein